MDESIENKLNTINSAFRAQYPISPSQAVAADYWCVETHDDYVIVANAEKYYRVGFTMNGDKPVFDERDKWLEVVRKISWDEVKAALEAKYGARNSRGDASRLQMIHDYAVENGAACGDAEKSVDFGRLMSDRIGFRFDDKQHLDTVVAYGDSIKALGETPEGGLHIGGYLVKFGAPDNTDQTGDYFTKDTDFGDSKDTDVYYHHRLPLKTRGGGEIIVKSKYGKGTLTIDDVGVFVDAVTYNRDQYDRVINQAVKATISKHGWSSGTASHTVERVPQANGSNWIKTWTLGIDASVTPTPAEPQTKVVGLKSLLDSPSLLEIPEAAQENRDESTATATEQPTTKSLGDQAMENEVLDSVKALTAKVEALETVIKSAPPVKTLGNGVEIKDNEKPFKSVGDQLLAIAAQARGEITERQYNGLKAITADHMKATGASEAVATDGGYLLQPEFSNDLAKQTFEYGRLLSLLNVQGVGPNSNGKIVNRVKETSIASTLFGGVVAYWNGEAGTYTASKPTFDQDEVKLQKVTGLYYATDEVLQDATALSGEINRMFPAAMSFKVESAIWEGTGVGMPLGITKGGSYVSVAKEALQSADTIVYENVIKMWSRVFPMSKRSNSLVWVCNSDAMPQLNTLVQVAGTAAIPARFVDWGADGIMRMMGRPVYEIPYASTVGDQWDIALLDLSWYDAIDKGGMQGASSIHVAFTTGEQVFRYTYRFGGKPSINYTVTPHKGSNTVAPFVTLDARA